MPTISRLGGLRVTVYPNDHRPARAHVIGGACEAIFDLQCPEGPPELRETYGFTQKQIAKIRTALNGDLTLLCDAWRRIHGNP
jgi:hypothetical protein